MYYPSARKRAVVELITFSQKTEKLLEDLFGATGRGLREKLDSVLDSVPRNLHKPVRFLARIRNDALHGDKAKVAQAVSQLPAARKTFEMVRAALDPSFTRPTFWARFCRFVNVPARIERYFTPLPGEAIVEIFEMHDRVEYLLERYYRAAGVGLHDKITSVADKIPEEITRNLRRIAAIRNQATHEDIANADKDVVKVRKAYEEVLPTLDRGATLRKIKYALATLAILAGAAYVAYRLWF